MLFNDIFGGAFIILGIVMIVGPNFVYALKKDASSHSKHDAPKNHFTPRRIHGAVPFIAGVVIVAIGFVKH